MNMPHPSLYHHPCICEQLICEHVCDVCSNVEAGTAEVRRLQAWCHRLLPDALNACCYLRFLWIILAAV